MLTPNEIKNRHVYLVKLHNHATRMQAFGIFQVVDESNLPNLVHGRLRNVDGKWSEIGLTLNRADFVSAIPSPYVDE